MQKRLLESAYITNKFDAHDSIKNNLLEIISRARFGSPVHEEAEVNITKTDWEYAQTNREWVSYIQDELIKALLPMYKELGYDGIQITDIWFQQYLSGSEHGWHIHSGNFTNVYYLELPEGTPKTQLVNPYNQKDIIEVDVKEGDLLAFPSYVLHKAPKNNSDKRKTIISYNINVVYSDDMYGENIK